MKRKIRTDVPTLWLCQILNSLRIVWSCGRVELLDQHGDWIESSADVEAVRASSYYCGPLFVSKENAP